MLVTFIRKNIAISLMSQKPSFLCRTYNRTCVKFQGLDNTLAEIRQECVKLLDQAQYIKGIISTVSRDPDPGTITAICTVCHTLMAHNKLLVHKTRYVDLTFLC